MTSPWVNPEKRAVDVLVGASKHTDPQAGGVYDTNHAQHGPLPPFTIPGAKGFFGGQNLIDPLPGKQDGLPAEEKANKVREEREKINKRLRRTDSPIILFEGAADPEFSIAVAREISKDRIFIGLSDNETEITDGGSLTIFPSSIVLAQAIELDLVTDFTSASPKIDTPKPFVIIGQSEPLGEATLHRRAPKLPNVIDLTGKTNDQRKKVLIDARRTDAQTTLANALGNPLSAQGKRIGGFIVRAPSTESQVGPTIKHLTNLLTVRDITARRNSTTSALGLL